MTSIWCMFILYTVAWRCTERKENVKMLSTGLHLPCGDVDVEADGAEMFIDNTVFKTAMMQRQRVPTSCYIKVNLFKGWIHTNYKITTYKVCDICLIQMQHFIPRSVTLDDLDLNLNFFQCNLNCFYFCCTGEEAEITDTQISQNPST